MDLHEISPQSIVEEVLTAWPQTVRVFLDHGCSCVGCELACFETLQDASRIYAFALEGFINELKDAARDEYLAKPSK